MWGLGLEEAAHESVLHEASFFFTQRDSLYKIVDFIVTFFLRATMVGFFTLTPQPRLTWEETLNKKLITLDGLVEKCLNKNN